MDISQKIIAREALSTTYDITLYFTKREVRMRRRIRKKNKTERS